MTNREVGEMIRTRRNSRGMTQAQLAAAIGVSESAVGMYESGRRRPKDAVVEALADVFNVPKWAILYREDEVGPIGSLPSNVRPISSLHTQRVPMIGEVAAGQPVYAPEDCEVYVDSPVKCDAAITIRGDSMIPAYQDGDVVYIRCRPDVDDGQVAVVFLDDEATIKHVYHEKDGLLLLSDNPKYAPIRATVEDYPNLRVFGVPVGFTRMYREDPLGMIHKGFPAKE